MNGIDGNSANELFPKLNQAKIKKPTETNRRLPLWLTHPTTYPSVNLAESSEDIDAFSDYIDDDLRHFLKSNLLITKLFPVQRSVIPNISAQLKAIRYRRLNDLCVSSPTGSGKTLAFVIPVVNHLKKSLSHSLRTLVVLPTRDLANQVYKTFESVCKATNLRCVLADSDIKPLQKYLKKLNVAVVNEPDIVQLSKGFKFKSQKQTTDTSNEKYELLVDIVVCTPGILVDLINNVPWFSVSELEILIVDEADRLMSNQKHSWLDALEKSFYTQTQECACNLNINMENSDSPCDTSPKTCLTSITGCSMKNYWKTRHIQKLLFSATLSSDPELLMSMNLFQPRLFLATKPTVASTKIRNSLGGDLFTPIGSPDLTRVNTRNELLTNSAIPEQLEEKMFILEQKEKLFCMWYMIHELKYKKVIVFTNLIPTGSKLTRFLNEIDGVRAVEFSSGMKPEQRKKILSEFNGGRVEVIVSTDLMARGMDVEGVGYVISYDMPTSEVFYVHRIGRTARAGKKGIAVTLVDTKQLVFFKKIVQLAHKKPNSMRLADVVEELHLPKDLKKGSSKMDLFESTLENYQDKMKAIIARRKKFIKN